MAAVDVFESEPILQGHPLLRLENAVCTPHIGYVEQDSYELYFGAAFDNVVNFINGTPTQHRQPRRAEGAALIAARSRAAGTPRRRLAARVARARRWALLSGNFVIGCGVMVVPGTLNDLARSLEVSVARGGQLIAIAAAVMCFGAPLLAGVVAGFDRRRLLAFALLWYALGHLLCAADAELRALLAGARADGARRGACSRRRPPRRSASWRRRSSAAARSPSSSSAGRSPRSLGMPIAAWLGETLRLAQRVRRGRGAERSPRAVVGLARDARRREAGGAVARGWKAVFTHPGADGDRARHRAVRRRPVHAVLVLRAVLQADARREPDADQPAVPLVRRLRAASATCCSSRASTASAPPRGAGRDAADRARRCCCGRWRTGFSAWRWCWCRGRSAASRRNSAQQARLGHRGAGARARR